MPWDQVMNKIKEKRLRSDRGPLVKSESQAKAIMLPEKRKADEGDSEYQPHKKLFHNSCGCTGTIHWQNPDLLCVKGVYCLAGPERGKRCVCRYTEDSINTTNTMTQSRQGRRPKTTNTPR